MKKVILSAFVAIATVIVIAVLSVIEKTIALQYAARVAPDQVNDHTDAYQILHAQSSIGTIFFIVEVVVFIVAVAFFVKIWWPRKSTADQSSGQ